MLLMIPTMKAIDAGVEAETGELSIFKFESRISPNEFSQCGEQEEEQLQEQEHHLCQQEQKQEQERRSE